MTVQFPAKVLGCRGLVGKVWFVRKGGVLFFADNHGRTVMG